MSFAAPLFLLATLAAAVPVAIHLIHRRQAKVIPFGTLRFLKLSVQRTRRRRYVDDAALMLLRAGALLAVAIGLARPAVTGLAGLTGGNNARSAVIVLDNSASMAIVDDGKPRLDTARRAAETVLGALNDGDSVALILTSGAPVPEIGRLDRSQETVRQALARARPSDERADLTLKLKEARGLLTRASTVNPEIYVITDNQALSWANLAAPKKGEVATEAAGTPAPLVVVNVSHAPQLNAAVRDVRLQSPAPVAGAPVVATAEVVNTSFVTQEKHLELFLDGARAGVSPTLTLLPGVPVRHAFTFTPDQPGVHRGAVRLVEDDGSPLDNRREFALTIDQQIRVAVVKPAQGAIPYAEDSFYLERALGSGDDSAVRTTLLTPDELASADLSVFAVVFCVDLPAVEHAAAGHLLAYVKARGHVVWVCGRNVEPNAYNRVNATADGPLIPAVLGALAQPPAGSNGSWHVAELDKDNPALRPLTEPTSLYDSVLVYRQFPLSIDPADAAVRVLARLDGGAPWLVERTVGSGSTLLLSSGLHVDWTNLPLKPLFLPLISRLTFHLAGAEAERSGVTAGSPLIVPLASKTDDPAEVEVVRPSGETLRLRVDDPKAKGQPFRYDDTHEAGVYIVRLVNAQPQRQYAFAVNLDPDEIDPATVATTELKTRFGRDPVVVCASPDELPAALQRLREGVSLRNPFLAAVLVALVAETFLANRRGNLPPEVVAPPPARQPETAGVAATQGDDVAEFLARLG